MIEKLMLAVGTTIILVGCVTIAPHKTHAILYNPDSKMTAECKVDPEIDGVWSYEAKLDHCVAGYQAAGYKRVDPVK